MTEEFSVSIVFSGRDAASPAMKQLDQNIGRVRQNTDLMNRSGQNLSNTLGNQLRTAAIGVGVAFVGMQLVGKIGELNQIGDAANRAEETFVALSGGADEAARGLEVMHAATGGIVSDLELMNAANSLFMTGLAQTADQAAELTGIAVTLGGALGKDAAGSIETLNAALLNSSYERLDALGISATRVRARVAELRQEGMDMQAAFAQATMEEGQEAVEGLGDAADAARTNVAQLETQAENAIQDLGQLINNVLEGLAGVALEGIDLVEASANSIVQGIVDASSNVPGTLPGTDISLSPVQDARLRVREWAALAAAQQAILNASNARTASEIETRRQLEAQVGMLAQQAVVEAEIAGLQADMQGRMAGLLPMFMTGQRGAVGGSLLFDAQEFQQVQAAMHAADFDLAQLQAKFDAGLISEETLTNAENLAGSFHVMADQAQRGFDIMKDLTLPQALLRNTDENELLGGISDSVMAQLQDNGRLTAEALAGIQEQFDLAAGRTTETMLFFQNNIVPTLTDIFEQQGGLVGIQRSQQVEGFQRRAAHAGLGDMATNVGMSLSTGTFGGIDFQSILEPFSLRLEEIRDSAIPDTETALASMPGPQAALDTTRGIEETLNRIVASEHVIRVRVDANVPGWLQPLLGGATALVREGVQGNSGVVPGQDTRGRAGRNTIARD